jgi:hypothetical protein
MYMFTSHERPIVWKTNLILVEQPSLQLYNIHLYFLWYKIYFYTKWFCFIHIGIWILNFFCTNNLLCKPISYILSSKLFWTCSFICGCSTKCIFNIYCPTCLTNPSLTSLSIYGHYVITCPLTLHKTKILEKNWANMVKSS